MHPPRVFISYSHDSSSHKLAVLELANRLRADGIDAMLDRYEAFPPEGWPRWMRTQIEKADAVLLVCSPVYKERFEGKAADKSKGVTWEGLVLSQSLYEEISRNEKRFIPVLLNDSAEENIPIELRAYSYFRYPDGYEDLIRLLTHQPPVLKPALGTLKKFGVEQQTSIVQARPVVSQGATSEGVESPRPRRKRSDPGEGGIQPESWHDQLIRRSETALQELNRLWHSERLSVIAGAGVSMESGLPSWNDLLYSMLVGYVERVYRHSVTAQEMKNIIEELEEALKHQSPIVFAQFIQARFPEAEFIKLVHEALYGAESSAPRVTTLARAIARLGHKLNSIVTFNWDDLLERSLMEEGHECTTVHTASGWAQVRGLPVYHPHGFLPHTLSDQAKYSIVLAERDYHTQYFSPFSWSNIAVTRALLESSCLFVGLSLTDPNLRRLLDASRREQPEQKHYMFLMIPVERTETRTMNVAQEALIEVMEASYQQLGITPIWTGSYDAIPKMIDSIRKIPTTQGSSKR